MDKPQPFVVPAGVTFQIADDGVVIENQGDIVLHTNFGRPLKNIVSTGGSITIHAPVEGGALHAYGDVTVHGDARADSIAAGGGVRVEGAAQVGTIEAGGGVGIAGGATGTSIHAGGDVAIGGDVAVGTVDAGGDIQVNGATTASAVRGGATVALHGAVKVDSVHGGVIRLVGSTITARGIQGTHAVHIGGAKLQVDAIIAPEVHLEPHTGGRVTVVESQNELGPNALKGGFRLVDYAEMFGDPANFLAERGLVPLGATPAPLPTRATPVPPTARAAAEPVVAQSVVTDSPTPEAPAPPPPMPTISLAEVEIADEPEAAAEPVSAEGESTGDTDTANGEVLVSEPAAVEVDEADEVSSIPEHPLHKQLVEAVTRIAESYTDGDLPPAVNHLMSLIEQRAYDQVRGEITSIWSDLLKYHQKKGLRIQHQVTTTFNTINSLVKKM
jgi:hypothetical protein